MQVPHELTVRGAPQLSVPLTLPQFLPRRVQKAALLSGVQLAAVVKLHTVPVRVPAVFLLVDAPEVRRVRGERARVERRAGLVHAERRRVRRPEVHVV